MLTTNFAAAAQTEAANRIDLYQLVRELSQLKLEPSLQDRILSDWDIYYSAVMARKS